ncbi:unnamed protein product [Cyclocybe aegerita]|uniref:Uncharacterized protein n=1 Tax=Cyclocybe aegerita TaxID=1973307 RepID=A0A8S0VW93_CYCAE|nr:unnamed protein product [Cyclocybe aegerita]
MSVQPSLPAQNVLDIPEFADYNRLAVEIADPDNWASWSVPDGWKLAEQDLQDFTSRWHGTIECGHLLDSESPSLPLPASFTSSLSLLSILVRKSYVKMFNEVWERAMSSDGAVGTLIIGQPGIGKTLFQYYLLVRLIQQKQPVLFSPDGDRLYLFYDRRVYTGWLSKDPGLELPEPKVTPSKLFIWSLFDIREKKEPKLKLICRPCLPVQTASPDPCRYKIWAKEKRPLVTGLPLWTRDELAQGLRHQEQYGSLLVALQKVYGGPSQYQRDPLRPFPGIRTLLEEFKEEGVSSSPEDALDYILEAAIDRFGYSARDVFRAVFDYDGTTEDHKTAFSTEYTVLQKAVDALSHNKSAIPDISNRILVLIPVRRGPLMRPGWIVDFKSDWVARSMIAQLDAAEDAVIRQQIHLFRRVPEAVGMAGRFFEPLAHRYIANTSEDDPWPLISVVLNNSDPPQFSVDPDTCVPGDVQFAKVKREVFRFQSIDDLSGNLKNNTYYIPRDPTFPLFDAFTVDLDHSKTAVLWILQITTSRLHGGSSLGYRKVRRIIASLKNQLREGMPPAKTMKVAAGQSVATPLVKVNYLLVIPKGDDFQKVCWQFPKGWSENCRRNDHRGNVYCLKISLAGPNIL